MTYDLQRFIEAVLANDEASTDAELVEMFREAGATAEEARVWVDRRASYLIQPLILPPFRKHGWLRIAALLS
jgi:hypothetical protein